MHSVRKNRIGFNYALSGPLHAKVFYYMHLLLIQRALFCFELLSLITISPTTPALRVRPELNIFLIWLIGEIADL